MIEKVAFLVHEPTMYAHYSSVWAEMPQSAFSIVLFQRKKFVGPDALLGADKFLRRIEAAGYDYCYFEDLVAKDVRFRCVVSNHTISGSQKQRASAALRVWAAINNSIKRLWNALTSFSSSIPKLRLSAVEGLQYAPLRIGGYQVRFMYGADVSDSWSLDAWNEIYDLFLCHGPNDEAHFRNRFRGRTALMGYPRYDGYFSENLRVDDVISEFEIDPAKSTILWMPTYDTFDENVCSIPYFANELSKLKDQFNIIVRPHPISFRLDREGIELLESLSFNIDREPARNMNKMFRIADTILCDHGGTAFGALYLGKKLVFLKTPTAETATVLKGSSNLELMEHFPVVDSGQVATLGALLNDADYWTSCLDYGKKLSDKYFADYRGNSSRITAEILADLNAVQP